MMPIQSYSSFQKMTRFCKTRVPPNIWNDLAAIKDDDEEVKAYGVQLCVDMCRTLSNTVDIIYCCVRILIRHVHMYVCMMN